MHTTPQPSHRRRRSIILAVTCAAFACGSTGASSEHEPSQKVQAQGDAQTPVIVVVSTAKGCFVRPGHALVDRDQPIRFLNATDGPVKLLFPTGETLFEDRAQILDVTSGQDILTATVVAPIGSQHDYAVFCLELNELAEGESHPTVIVK